jgi:hypothetical protein
MVDFFLKQISISHVCDRALNSIKGANPLSKVLVK